MADSTMLQLPVATALDGTEYTWVNQTGTDKRATTGLIAATSASTNFSGAIEVIIDGAGMALPSGVAAYMTVPFNCNVTAAVLLANVSGSTIVDVWKCTYDEFDAGATHPVSGDSITGGNPPTITASTKSSNALTDWTTGLDSGDVLAFNVGATTTISRVTLTLNLQRVVS